MCDGAEMAQWGISRAYSPPKSRICRSTAVTQSPDSIDGDIEDTIQIVQFFLDSELFSLKLSPLTPFYFLFIIQFHFSQTR
jgi:hypothetical protein